MKSQIDSSHPETRDAPFNNRYAIEIPTPPMQPRPMANTYTSLHYHIIFSTKNREPFIDTQIEQRVWEFMGGIARANDLTALLVGGMPDHVHIILGLPATISLSDAVKLIKGGSSK